MFLVKIFIVNFSITWVYCSVEGINYMDPINMNPHKTDLKNDNPCNPLYWYPRNIPDFCYNKKISNLLPPVPPPPRKIPYPMAPQLMPPMFPMLPPPLPFPPSPYMMPAPPLPMPMYPPPPLPFGIPIEPTYPMLPVAGLPALPYPNLYPPSRPLASMVPGLPGLVTQDGGINILPFSDAYADLLESHKQKILRKKLEKILRDYNYPRTKSRSRNRN